MATRRYVFKQDAMTGGVNDSPFPDTRAQNQAKTQTNVRATPELTLEKAKGRLKHATAQDVGGTVTDIMVPPKKTAIATLTSANNAIYIGLGAAGARNYDTASVAAGAYYTYTALAAAIQAAFIAASFGHAGADDWVVTYTARSGQTPGYFTVKNSSVAWLVCWNHALTTFGPSIIGYQWSVAAAANTSISGATVLDQNMAGESPCRNGDTSFFSIANGALYDVAKTQQYYDDGSAYSFSSQKIAGAWHNNKYYFSDGNDNYVLRHWRPKKTWPNDLLSIRNASVQTVASTLDYQYTVGAATLGITLNNTYRVARLPMMQAWVGGAWAATIGDYLGLTRDKIKLWLARAAGSPDFDVNIYIETFDGSIPIPDGPSFYRKTLIDTLNWTEITTTAGGAEVVITTNYTIDDVPANCKRYVLVEFSPRTQTAGSLEIYGAAVALADQAYYLEPRTSGEDALWTTDDGAAGADGTAGATIPANWAWYGEVSTNAITCTGSLPIKFKVAAENADGFITELSQEFTATTSAGNNIFDLQFGCLDTDIRAEIAARDIKYIVAYRTIENGSIYYEWVRVPVDYTHLYVVGNTRYYMNAINSLGTIHAGISDTVLQTQPEADVTTYRTAEFPYDKCCLWDNRLFVVTKDSDVVYYSEVNQPENFNLNDGWSRIGFDGSPINGIAPCGDRIVTIKESSIHYGRPSGAAYAFDSVNDDGIGTLSHWSLVSDFGKGGSVVFFQGQDSRFYVTDGVNLTPLSGGSDEWAGRLEEFVKGASTDALAEAYTGRYYQNPSFLSETVAFLDVPRKAVVWSCATGTKGSGNPATTPNLNVVFSQTAKSFCFETMPAYIWKTDHLTTGAQKYIGAYNTGGASQDLVWYKESLTDLTNAISSAWESADYDFGEADEVKHFISMEISGYATAAQTLAVTWYIDGSGTQSGASSITLTTAPAKYRINCPARGKTIRVKLSDSATTGIWKVNQILAELEHIKAVKR